MSRNSQTVFLFRQKRVRIPKLLKIWAKLDPNLVRWDAAINNESHLASVVLKNLFIVLFGSSISSKNFYISLISLITRTALLACTDGYNNVMVNEVSLSEYLPITAIDKWKLKGQSLNTLGTRKLSSNGKSKIWRWYFSSPLAKQCRVV